MKTIVLASTAVLAALAGQAAAQCGVIKLEHFQPETGDRFGACVAAAANLAVVGSPNDDLSLNENSGSFHVFQKDGGVWNMLFSSVSGTANEIYGRSVATDGTLISVGEASGPIAGNYARGGGIVTRRVNNTWPRFTVPTANLNPGDDFGFSTAVGNGRIVFGAPRRDFAPGDDMGGVFAYRLDANNQVQLVTSIVRPAFSSQAGEHFGYSVAIAPQGGPNPGMLVVGAPDRDSASATSTGGIYVFNQTGVGYSLQNLPSQWDENFQFNGLAVATNGRWIASGAPSFGNARGRVFLYERLPNGNWEVSGFISGPDGDGGNFGYNISMSGDLMVVRAPGLDRSYVYRDHGSGWALHRIITNDALEGSGVYSAGVATNGLDIFTGDIGDTADGVSNAGTVAVQPFASTIGGDHAAGPEPIAVPASLSGCLEGATPTPQGLPGVCGASVNAPDVFFAFTARRDAMIIADTIGSTFDTVLSAHDAEPTWQDAHVIACNDDINGSLNRQSRVTFPVEAGRTYWLRVAGYNGAVGGFNINVRYDCAADFNQDGFVDFFDYDDFVSCYEGVGCPSDATADVNGDGFVDFFDYDDFVAIFEAGC
jgi:hypothetical protein